MAEILDILTHKTDEAPYFTANNAVDYVGITTPPGSTELVYNGMNLGKFTKGDNFTIESIGFILPETYTIWKNRADLIPGLGLPLARAVLTLKGAVSGLFFSIEELGANFNPVIYLPSENYEHEISVFVNVMNQRGLAGLHPYINEDFYIHFSLTIFGISQRGQPAAFNAKTFLINPFLKISHNISLS